jgi:hypothetical protein
VTKNLHLEAREPPISLAGISTGGVINEGRRKEASTRGAPEPDKQVQADVCARVDAAITADAEGDELGDLPT